MFACVRQVTRAFSSKAQRGAITWVNIDHFKLRQTPSKGLVDFMVEDVPKIYFLREKIALLADRFGLNRMNGDISIYHGDKQLDIYDDTPTATKENPLLAKIAPTEEEEREREKEERAISLAQKFVDKLMTTEFETLEIPEGMEDPPEPIYVLRDIPKINALDTSVTDEGAVEDIYVRECVRRFWDKVGKTVQSRPLRKPLCAVGAPGIGKSTTFPVLMQMLLRDGKVVTYIRRTPEKASFYYQFRPDTENGSCQVHVFPETTRVGTLPSMDDPEAYMLVDPGETKDTCNYSVYIQAKLVINSSPNSDHWGRNEFIKLRSNEGLGGGSFLYFPPYTLEELLVVVPNISPNATLDTISEDFFEFGGSIRLHSADQSARDAYLTKRSMAMRNLAKETAESILRGVHDVDFSNPSPPSSVVSLTPTTRGALHDAFEKCFSTIQSSAVLNVVADKCQEALLFDAEHHRKWRAMEKLARLWLQDPRGKISFQVRSCVGKQNMKYEVAEDVNLGGRQGEERHFDLFQAVAKAGDNSQKLFYSSDERHKLIDLAYREGNDIHAFNATINKAQNRKKLPETWQSMVKELVRRLAMKENKDLKVHLYYLTLPMEFDGFVTSPVDPQEHLSKMKDIGISDLTNRFLFYHCRIPLS